MKKFSLLLIIFLTLYACSKKEGNLVINGKIQDLKEGTVYLQKVEDTLLVTLDSVVINGQPDFTLQTDIDEPQVFYIYLSKVDNSTYDDRFLFFAEPGEMTISTTLENFETDVVVEGSENQAKLVEFRKMMDRFNSQNLDLLKESIEAQRAGDQEKTEEVNSQLESLLRRRYLFTVNYALNHKEYEVAPYLAISEVFDANLKYLDTIYNTLEPAIQESMYGQTLQELIQERRDFENEMAADQRVDTTSQLE